MNLKATKIDNIEDVKYGDLIFFKPTGSKFSKLIPIIDGSPFSHVGFCLGKKYGHYLFIEAQDGIGIVINRVQEWRNYEIVRTDLTPMPPFKLLEDLGKPYDRMKILELAKHKIFGTPLSTDDDHALICSEAVNKWYYYKLFDKGHATPATIYNNLEYGN